MRRSEGKLRRSARARDRAEGAGGSDQARQTGGRSGAVADLDFLEAIEDQLDAAEYERAKAEFERSGEPAIPWEKVKSELGL